MKIAFTETSMEHTIDISQLPTGLNTMLVHTSRGKEAVKFIKQ